MTAGGVLPRPAKINPHKKPRVRRGVLLARAARRRVYAGEYNKKKETTERAAV